jgi:hypothetical protein
VNVVEFKKLVEGFVGLKCWDYLVECEIPDFWLRRRVVQLGYYGYPIEPEDAERIIRLEPWKAEKAYGISYAGIDGAHTTWYDELPEIDIIGCWTVGVGEYRNDYARFECIGFTLSDVGINWEDHRA